MVPLPTLRQLQFYLALVRRESFSRAAEDCLVSQSTLSSAIKELEAIVDAQLVDRSTRAFALTPAGSEFARQAADILARSEDLVLSVRDRELLSESFHLGVIPTIAPFVIPKITPTLRKKHPKLRLYLREDLTAALVDRLQSGLLDAALLALPYDMDGIETEVLGEDEFWFACAPEHALSKPAKEPVSANELRDVSLLLLEDGHCLRDHAIDACNLRSAEQSAEYGATSLLTLTEMTRAGIGATLLPAMAVRQGLAKAAGLTIRPLESPRPSRTIGLAWRAGSGRADEARALVDYLRNAVENSA